MWKLNEKDNRNTQKATKFEISFIFTFRILLLEFAANILYVVNFGGLNKVHFVSFKAPEIPYFEQRIRSLISIIRRRAETTLKV